ncbi:hypothetical protein [Microbacterium sp.]|uniref:hypothetical protein n=1 Tax=Microbacterium sp. TaxID=51671 RepID=UPI0039E2A449
MMISLGKAVFGWHAEAVWPHLRAWGMTRKAALARLDRKTRSTPVEAYRPRFSDPTLYDSDEEWWY